MVKTILFKTKKDIINRIAANTSLNKKQAAEAVDEAFAEILDTLKDGGEMSISGFGKFEVRTRPARTGVNPKTGEKIQIPESKSPAFKASKTLKDAVK
ncbi:MAG: HU family DNA-binding protein [Solobacterium sp.]|nr:HU family DNA-binding protein [Solobacterium sp.]